MKNDESKGNKRGAADVFAIISFIAGCISLSIGLLMLANLGGGARGTKIFTGIYMAIILTCPGLVFGIISLIKTTRLRIFAILGVIFNASLFVLSII